MRARFGLLTFAVAASGFTHCSSDETPDDFGQAEVALTNSPTDVSCLRVTIAGTSRTDIRKFPMTAGQRAVFRLNGLPVGNVSFSADAFPVACTQALSGVRPTWHSEPVAARLNGREVAHVALSMIHNGTAPAGIDFDDGHGPASPGKPILPEARHALPPRSP